MARRKSGASPQSDLTAAGLTAMAASLGLARFQAHYPEAFAAAAARAAASAPPEHPALRPTTEPALILVPRGTGG